MRGSRKSFRVFQRGSISVACYCAEILLLHLRLFRGTVGSNFLFMDDDALCHRTPTVEEILDSEDIQHMDWLARSLRMNPVEHMWGLFWRRLQSRDKAPSTIPELKLALQDE